MADRVADPAVGHDDSLSRRLGAACAGATVAACDGAPLSAGDDERQRQCASPADVTINGKIEVYNRCLAPDYCIALVNFWRSLSNLTLDINPAGQDGCRSTPNFYAVSQASSIRRMGVAGGTFSLMDYCTAGPQFASGGFIADSKP